MGRRIHDEFTARTDVSRQRRWQLRKMAAGFCSICGRRRVTKKYCALHRRRVNARRRKVAA